jgi:hypothetical protein
MSESHIETSGPRQDCARKSALVSEASVNDVSELMSYLRRHTDEGI